MSKKHLSIEGVMHPFPHSIGDHQTLSAAKEMMNKYDIRHLPVQRGGELLGILSDRDIRYVQSLTDRNLEEIPVSDAYIEEPYVVEPSEGLQRVTRRMADEKIGCAMVVENGKLVGIFTTVDACRTLSDLLSGSLEDV